jgi:hypothetical protein
VAVPSLPKLAGTLLILVVVLSLATTACGRATKSTPTPRNNTPHTGIAAVDRLLSLIVQRDATGLASLSALIPQTCQTATEMSPTGPISCVPALGQATPITAADNYFVTSVPAFAYAKCARTYLTTPSEVESVIQGTIGSDDHWSIYAIGHQSVISKNDDGYVVLVTPGEVPSATATVSMWYLDQDGRLISIVDDCNGVSAADTAAQTGALIRPLLTPSP